jgi:hypothetical protein|tara:strand:+ start:1859 stop:2083 length:225 start_codon:yes stop_codon:yes gene_type:complete
MIVKEYINTLIEIVKKNPEIEDYKVIYSSDSEGSTYEKVHYTPTVMEADGFDNAYLEVKPILTINDKANSLCIN